MLCSEILGYHSPCNTLSKLLTQKRSLWDPTPSCCWYPQTLVPTQRPQISATTVPLTHPGSVVHALTPLTRSTPQDLLKATYRILNTSQPEQTADCQLCLNAKPPYYDHIVVSTNYMQTSKESYCWWARGQAPGVTLEVAHSMGICIVGQRKQIPLTGIYLCNESQIFH